MLMIIPGLLLVLGAGQLTKWNAESGSLLIGEDPQADTSPDLGLLAACRWGYRAVGVLVIVVGVVAEAFPLPATP